MEETIISPSTGGIARLMNEQTRFDYKGGNYEVTSSFYRCEDTGQDYCTPEQFDKVVLQLRAEHKKAKKEKKTTL